MCVMTKMWGSQVGDLIRSGVDLCMSQKVRKLFPISSIHSYVDFYFYGRVCKAAHRIEVLLDSNICQYSRS